MIKPERLSEYVTLYEGDCLASLKAMPDESVQCCVTSPPYYGLRDYDVDGQIGLESTPAEYVERMVNVFRQVRRVLNDDGTLWLNIGDSYAGSGKGGNPEEGKQATNCGSQSIGVLYGTGRTAREAAVTNVTRKTFDGIKAKDIIGIPWMLAFALRNDGWYLRQDIIWHKPNPMPESVTDRCTKAHEYLFLLTKSARYFYDAGAIAEPATTDAPHKHWTEREHDQSFLAHKQANGVKGRPVGVAGYMAPGKRNRRSVWRIPTKSFHGAHFAVMPKELVRPCIKAGSKPGDVILDPFGGSGTVGVVACEEDRAAVMCELNPEYCEIIRGRIATAEATEPTSLFKDVKHPELFAASA